MTELHDAARYGDLNKCHELIEHDADVNAKDKDGTPLHDAARRGHLKVCEVFIKHGANQTAQ